MEISSVNFQWYLILLKFQFNLLFSKDQFFLIRALFKWSSTVVVLLLLLLLLLCNCVNDSWQNDEKELNNAKSAINGRINQESSMTTDARDWRNMKVWNSFDSLQEPIVNQNFNFDIICNTLENQNSLFCTNFKEQG